jgi:ATP-dependent Lhr-like helicase
MTAPVTDMAAPPDMMRAFHPAVAAWFARRFPDGPTAPQREAWPHIAEGMDVLVASPTGTGKTLTGFLVAIDAAYKAAEAGTRQVGLPEVLYVSPLRALAVDVHENLHVPLAEIKEEAARMGYADPGLRVAVRTGDTPAAERAAMRKNAPDILVTTPESLYLLLTAPSSRALLRGVHTVIID